MTRIAALVLLPVAAFCADWDAKIAARYLDGRAAEWASWKTAAREGGPCLSCHTSLSYLLARPALRRKLGERGPTEFETGLLSGVKARAASVIWHPGDLDKDNAPTVVAALAIALSERGPSLSEGGEKAFRNLWAMQRRDGSWGWTDADLEPWEVPESPFFGAELAAIAVGSAAGNYQARPDVEDNVHLLRTYLRQGRDRQPLANRLLLLWAARLNGVLTDAERRSIIEEALGKQRDDGGWTLGSLGPWRDRPKAPTQEQGASAYATAWATFLLEIGGVPRDDPRLGRALAWLRGHQDPTGFWEGVSMNKVFAAGSMQERFMRDATTAFAVMALVEASDEPK